MKEVSFPTPHTPHPTPHTLHPTPHTLHPTPSFKSGVSGFVALFFSTSLCTIRRIMPGF
ncbi:DNA gyrase subunit A [Microcystis aeruginosa NIES-44]|uniref:DNA gyrase subunit A n=1 Tax=Microcystis aeruginosa NIES-44 TaxID=449439 RepID=A0A0A1VYX9_MICAE|nr:DNA gyrase subunit A [Microcystis aeruginosa NIES-44]